MLSLHVEPIGGVGAGVARKNRKGEAQRQAGRTFSCLIFVLSVSIRDVDWVRNAYQVLRSPHAVLLSHTFARVGPVFSRLNRRNHLVSVDSAFTQHQGLDVINIIIAFAIRQSTCMRHGLLV